MGQRWWQNGLVWLTVLLVGVIAVIPPGVAVLVDHFRNVHCVKPAHDIGKSTVIGNADLTDVRVVRFEAPRHPATTKQATGHIATQSLKMGECVAAEALQAPPLSVEIALAGVSIPPDAKSGDSVDLLFAPTSGQDSRDGAAVDDVKVAHVDSSVIVEVTKAQREVILKYLGRSRLIVRPHA